MNRLEEYYSHPAVRERLAEYCGGTAALPDNFSAQYLVGYGRTLQNGGGSPPFRSFSRKDFDVVLRYGFDLFRSVWDRAATLGVLDLEYADFRNPGTVFLHPHEIFEKIEPVYEIALDIFYKLNITPLAILTGQGYHFAFQVQRDTLAHQKLENLGRLSDSLTLKYRRTHGRRQEPVAYAAGKAFEGMGRLMEYVGHRILREVRKRGFSGPPVTFTDVAVGGAGESVVLDFSMYADPLYMRDVRCPFSGYQKHKVQAWKVGENIAREVPVQLSLPRVTESGQREWSLNDLLPRRADFRGAADLAETCRTSIPDVTDALVNLIDSYTRSALYRFHAEFDSVAAEPSSRWPQTYDFFDPTTLPPCVGHCLLEPNDSLLKPTNLQTLTRVLVKRGWHPKHVAGLVRSKYEQTRGWDMDWRKYDAATHAEFYVRQFAGLLITGLDGEPDLNCVSHQEKGYCWKPFCGHNLADERLS